MLHITSGTVEVLTFACMYQDRNIEFSALANYFAMSHSSISIQVNHIIPQWIKEKKHHRTNLYEQGLQKKNECTTLDRERKQHNHWTRKDWLKRCSYNFLYVYMTINIKIDTFCTNQSIGMWQIIQARVCS